MAQGGLDGWTRRRAGLGLGALGAGLLSAAAGHDAAARKNRAPASQAFVLARTTGVAIASFLTETVWNVQVSGALYHPASEYSADTFGGTTGFKAETPADQLRK